MMKLFVIFSFVVAGATLIAADEKLCKDLESKNSFLEEMTDGSKWFYGTTNHLTEECNTATYTKDGTNGLWLVNYENGTVHMTCQIYPSEVPDNADKNMVGLRVRESGSTYELGTAFYEPDQYFCWFQCARDQISIDFWHCAMSEKFAESSDYTVTFFEDKLKETGVAGDTLMKLYPNYEDCSNTP